jgi:hypothetical protein
VDDATLHAALRYFPLTGRPRPACRTLPERVTEVEDITKTARQPGADVVHHTAHALNKAALLASDCGLPGLARDLCWRHIDAYRDLGRPLVIAEARGILEPTLNLARLAIRAAAHDEALRLLDSIDQALADGADLIISGTVLPLAGMAITGAEHRKLREWAWLQHLSEGIRANALLGRWGAAERHAIAHRGIGDHLMEGRQAAIIARLADGNRSEASQVLSGSTVTEPWERHVAACLAVMCAGDQKAAELAATLARGFAAADPIPGYAVYRARLGLTVVTLACGLDPAAAGDVTRAVAAEAIASADGNATREVLTHPDAGTWLPSSQRQSLRGILDAAGLGAGSIPEPLYRKLLTAAAAAETQLRAALQRDAVQPPALSLPGGPPP